MQVVPSLSFCVPVCRQHLPLRLGGHGRWKGTYPSTNTVRTQQDVKKRGTSVYFGRLLSVFIPHGSSCPGGPMPSRFWCLLTNIRMLCSALTCPKGCRGAYSVLRTPCPYLILAPTQGIDRHPLLPFTHHSSQLQPIATHCNPRSSSNNSSATTPVDLFFSPTHSLIPSPIPTLALLAFFALLLPLEAAPAGHAFFPVQ